MRLKRCLIQLFHLRVKAIILKGIGTSICVIFDIQMYELRAKSHHLRNALDQIVSHLIAETHSFSLMLIQVDDPLSTPRSFILF